MKFGTDIHVVFSTTLTLHKQHQHFGIFIYLVKYLNIFLMD